MTSVIMRQDPLFMRNDFETQGKWEIPLVKRQEFSFDNVRLIACSDTRRNDNEVNKQNGVHFFVDDYRFRDVYNHPERTFSKYSQYAFLLTPDYSLYAEMGLWLQIANVAKNRWVGAYWQSKGLIVIPTISWSTASSFDFCFDGVEEHSVVAVGMIGCKDNHLGFMRGYNMMLERLQPSTILCFGTPFPEMTGNIISVDYRKSRKVVR